ncbi:MAG: serine hydrolase [Spirochaetales bacterium]|nr:serine hydrolase [Spirochaetales bacterium]
MRNSTIAVTIVISVLCSLSCTSTAKSSATVWPTQTWYRSSPEAAGLDSRNLAAMIEQIDSGDLGIDSVAVMRGGVLVLEAYKYPTGPETLHIIHSCTKSVVSTLIGIAIDKGLIDSVKVPVNQLFSDSEISSDLQLEHLLTMTTGLKSEDSYLYSWKGLTEMRQSNNWAAHALSREREATPGSRFEYSNMSSFLLSAALQEAAGLKTEDFAQEYLFSPLGITDYSWPENPEGINLGWGELKLKLLDLVKFGLLVLNDGIWDGRIIVSKKWIKEATKRQVNADTLQPYYGYQWWVSPDDTVLALGYAGQYLIISRDENLIAVFNSTLPDRLFEIPESLYRNYIIPSAKSRKPLVDNPAAARHLREALSNWTERPAIEKNENPPLAYDISDKVYKADRNPYGLSALQFTFSEDAAYVHEIYANETQVYNLGMNGLYAFTNISDQEIGTVARWLDEKTLWIRYFGLGAAWWTELTVVFTHDSEDAKGSIRVMGKGRNGNISLFNGRET